MCVTLRNAIYFHLHPVRRHAHPACLYVIGMQPAAEPRPWLAPDTVLSVHAVIHSTSAGNDINRELGAGDGKPGYQAEKSLAGMR